MVLPFRISLRILSTFMFVRLLCQAHRIPEKWGNIYHGMYQIHRVQIGRFRQKAVVVDCLQKDVDQFSLCAVQIASPRFMDIVQRKKKCRSDLLTGVLWRIVCRFEPPPYQMLLQNLPYSVTMQANKIWRKPSMKKLQFNAPVILGFFFVSLLSLVLGLLTSGASTTAVFSVYRASLLDPLTYIRFFGHIFSSLSECIPKRCKV